MNLTMKSLNLERIFKKGNLGKCLLANRVILKINLSLSLPSGFLLPLVLNVEQSLKSPGTDIQKLALDSLYL
jgi:hypothetical protein